MKTRKIIKALPVVAALALAGCMSSGTQVTEQQASQFKAGVTSREQVMAALGAPNATSIAADGTRIDVYMHVHAAANAASYIPIVGALAGGAHATTNSATFTYSKAGMLQAVSTTSADSEAHTGLLNQR